MPYHSKIAAQSSIGNVAMLPFRTKFRGPITNYPESDTEMDIIDETLYYFRPNVFFKSFEIQSNSDRVLIYLTLYIIECLKRLQRLNTREQALADMHALAISRFDLPGNFRPNFFNINLLLFPRWSWLSPQCCLFQTSQPRGARTNAAVFSPASPRMWPPSSGSSVCHRNRKALQMVDLFCKTKIHGHLSCWHWQMNIYTRFKFL